MSISKLLARSRIGFKFNNTVLVVLFIVLFGDNGDVVIPFILVGEDIMTLLSSLLLQSILCRAILHRYFLKFQNSKDITESCYVLLLAPSSGGLSFCWYVEIFEWGYPYYLLNRRLLKNHVVEPSMFRHRNILEEMFTQ